ncbi:MAG: ABC transporter permease [Candidatus Acidiferrales bacterium]
MGTVWQDVRYGLRLIAKNPGFAAIAILTLALGIGASAAIFSVIDGVLLNPFPYAHSDRLVVLEIDDADQSGDNGARSGVTAEEFHEYAAKNQVFDRVAGFTGADLLYTTAEGTERFNGQLMAPGTFEAMGVAPLLGRTITAEDYKPGAPPVFAMRYKLWATRFNSDPNIVNQTFVLNGVPRTLVAVMPPRFALGDGEMWVPDALDPAHASADLFFRDFIFIGGLKPGVTVEQAEADLTSEANHLATVYPNQYPKHFRVHLEKYVDATVGQFRQTLLMVSAAVGLLLLIGCANVASLLMARATTREKELAVRAALGASRGRLVRQMLIESLLLAAGGAILGCLLAWLGLTTLVAMIPPQILPQEAVVTMNAPVLLFALGVAVATAILFGLAPALEISGKNLNSPLRDGGKGSAGGFRQGRVRSLVVATEVALSLTLLVGAGLLMRSFIALRDVNLGLNPDHVLVTRLPLPESQYKTADQVSAFFRVLLPRLKALPGVVDVTETSTLPPYGGLPSGVEIPGKTPESDWRTFYQLVSTDYFATLRIAILQGRAFNQAEENGARKVAVVNQAFAKTYWGGQDPIGQRFRIPEAEKLPDPVHDAWFEIVGVAADAKNQGLEKPVLPEVWVPYTITGSGRRGVMVRTAGDPMVMMHAVQTEVWATDRNVALAMSDKLENYIQSYSYAQPEFGFLLMAIFAGVGLVLVTIGVYSVIAYSTARRTQEIGIRMALGAEPGSICKLIILQGGRLAVMGVAVGLVSSFALTRVLASMLFEVKPNDPLIFAGVAALLLGVTLLACFIPARRAMKVDPIEALRHE